MEVWLDGVIVVNRMPSARLLTQVTILLLGLTIPLPGLNLVLDMHGSGLLGKYLNSDSIRYNMDASVELHCTFITHKGFSWFVQYRDDLDMAKQEGGVTLDPRYTHYYIISGLDYSHDPILFTAYFVHDCVHDIDHEIEGTPVFNRIRFQMASYSWHGSAYFVTRPLLQWKIDIGLYPHWYYHNFDINSGADYKYDVVLEMLWRLWQNNNFGLEFCPLFRVARGSGIFYHQHLAGVKFYKHREDRRMGLALEYNIKNNDPIKSPEHLWFLSIFVEF